MASLIYNSCIDDMARGAIDFDTDSFKVMLVDATTYTSSATINSANGKLRFGANIHTTGGNPMKGYIDEIRVTKGVARYTANFTAPTAAFPDS